MIENEIFKNTLALLSAALNGTDYSLDMALWPEIKKELQYQAVLALANDFLQKSDIDKDEKKELTKLTVINTYKFLKIMSQQTEVMKLFEENDISCAVLKGTSCAQYYKKPERRQFGDIDILVLPKDYNKALELFAEKGYKQLDATDAAYQRHIGFDTPSGIEIELHRFFSSSNNEDQNSLLDKWLYKALENPKKIKIKDHTVSVFPDLETGIVILGHINQHLGSGLGLRHITDWMMYVKANLTDEFWETKFQEKAKAIGMEDLAKTLTRMCQMYLGLSSEISWCKDADEDLAEELMLYVMKKGNFGSKIDSDSNKTITVMHNFSNPVKAFKYLTSAGSVRMKEAGLKPIKAFAWIYQIDHLLSMTAKRKSRKNLTKELKCGADESEFLKRLKVTR